MYRFVILSSDNKAEVICVGGRDLQHAFDTFSRDFWRPEMTSAIGIWRNSALEARVIPRYEIDSEKPHPVLEILPIRCVGRGRG